MMLHRKFACALTKRTNTAGVLASTVKDLAAELVGAVSDYAIAAQLMVGCKLHASVLFRFRDQQ